jgi:hypothetical protein
MLIDLVVEFVTHAPGYALMVAVLVTQYVHGRVSRRA